MSMTDEARGGDGDLSGKVVAGRVVRSVRRLALWRWRRWSALAGLAFLAALGAAGYQLAGATGNQPNGTCGFCVLEPSGEALKLTGSGNVSLTKANVIVNSASKPAVAATGSGSLKAPSVGVVGTASVTGSGKIENLTTGIAAVSDPLAGLVVPSVTVPSPVPSVSVTGSTGKTVEPGVYKEITDTASGSLTLNPGTYVILQKFANTGSGTLTAKGVMLYLACSDYPTACKAGEKGATLSLTGSGAMNFTAPEAGCSPVAVFSDRNSTAPLAITGSSSQTLNGVIYAKSGSLALTGSGGTFTIGGPIVVGSASTSGQGGVTLTGELPMTEGLKLALSRSPASAHVGETETLTATLSCNSKPLAGQPASFTITGANSQTETATTNASGVAKFSYIGKATGSDTASAAYTANGASVSSTPATVTWSNAKPTLATKPTASQVTLGEAISDTATLTGGYSPTGTISFNVYSSTDTSCKTPLNEKPLTATLSGGAATSPRFTPSAPGTYQFLATYSGDQSNEAVAGTCGEASEQVKVEGSVGPINAQPRNQTVNEGGSASFTATAGGYPAPSVQWQVSTTGGLIWENDGTDKTTSTPEAGQSTSTLTVSSAVRAENGYEYRAIFTNAVGSVTSNAATLNVDWMGPIESQPQSATANEGTPVSFTAASSSNPAADVQWQFSTNAGSSWSNDTTDSASTSSESGKTTSTLTISSSTRAQNGYEYRAVFTNAGGGIASNAATLTVHWIGPITTQPESRAVNEGQSTSFTAAAAANPAAGVQWQLSSDGGSSWSNDTSDTASTSSESGQTTSTLTISSATRAQNGYEYRAVFTSAAGSVTSNAASLTVDWIGPVSTQPESQATVEGKTVSLTAAVSSNPSASAQWQFSSDSGAEWVNDTSDSASTTSSGGTTTSTLTIASAKHSRSGYEYRAVFTNPVGTTTSSAASVMVEPASGCTDIYDGPSGGLWQTASNWSTGNTPTSSDVACVGPGTTVDVTGGTNAAGVLLDQGGLAMFGGSLELSSPVELVSIPGLEVSTTSSLELSGGTLSLGGTLDVASSLSGGDEPTISGSGKLVLESGATGRLDSGGCSTYPVLSGATFVNDGTFTFGAPGGSADGAFLMSDGAQIENAGTFNDDSYDPGCGRGYGGSSIESLGGTEPSVTNTGSFNTNLGSPGASTQLAAAFNNSGMLDDEQGGIDLSAGGSGTHATWSAASEATLAFSNGSFALEGDTWSGEGTVAVTGAAVSASALKGTGASTSVSGGSLTIEEGPAATVSKLTLVGGTLSLEGELDVSSSLSGGGGPTISGSGRLVLESGASGRFDSGGCSTYPVLSGATFVNDGTFTFGAPGGSADGAFLMSDGAQIENAGTFNDDSYDPGCGRGYGGSAIENLGGTQPSVTNTGNFNVNLGSGGSAQIGVGFLNDGSVRALGGSVSFTGGGIEEQVATGCWYAESGAALSLSNGVFVIEEGGTFQATVGSGAKVTFTSDGLSGSLEAQPYAAGTVTLKGHGEESNTRFVFAHATVEATPKGTGEWKSIGAPLTPDSGGNFSAQWNTASGGYPDGHYELRAKISNNCACEKSIYTTPSAVRVANSPLVLSPSKGGPDAIGASQAFTATLSGASGEPLTGKTVELHVAGANPKTLTALTNSEGEASFSYTGEAEGTDTVHASYAPPGEAPITSNTASVSWFLALREVSSTPIQGNFYPANDSASGFSAKPGDTPAFSQTFPTIDFNPEAANPTVVGDVENGEGMPFSGAGSVAFSGQGALLSAQTPIRAQANWTLEAWIDPAKLNQDGMVIYNGDSGGNLGANGEGDNGFGFGVFGQNGSAGGCLTGLYELVTWINTDYCFSAANHWYYVAEVNVEGTVTFYVNGAEVYRSSEPTPYAPSGQMIGGYGTSERDFYGQISNAAFYRRPLSAGEIQSHYNASQAPNVSQSSYGGAIESSAPAAFYALSRVPHNTDPWFVTPETRPFTDLTTDETGAVNGIIPAEGNELKAGLGSLETFEASFTANFVVAQAGDVTFKITSEDGFLLGVGGGASRVSGENEGAPESNTSAFQGLPLVGAYDKTCCSEPQDHLVTVHFPGPGSYPYELDYFQHGGKQLSLQMEVQSVTPDASPLSVFVGYADGLRPAGNIFPFPWEGSPGVDFIGQLGPGYDSGALRFDNSGETPISLEDVSVDIGSAHTDLWGNHIQVAPHGITILAQTEGNNFDTSDEPTIVPCNETPDGLVPQIHVTSAGKTTTYQDTGQVLNTGGIDPGDCNENESHAWTRIGGEGVSIDVPMPPAVSLELSPSTISGDQVGQTQNLSIRARNAGGAAVAGLPINVHIYGPNAQNISLTTNAAGVAEGSYVGHIAGKDNISATASVEGLQVASNQLIVPWAIPVEPPPPPPPTEVSEGEVPGGEPPSVEIITPFGGSIVTGSMPVVGYVSGEEDTRWSLTLSPAGGDATAVQLASGTGSVEVGTLGTIEASKLGEGSYTLALTASTSGGSATENVPLTIGSKPGIPPPPPTETSSGAPTLSDESPASGSVIGVTTAVSAHATAPEGQTISGWTVTLTPLGEDTPTVLAETTAEHPSTLATIEPERFKSGTYTLMIEVHASGGGYATSSATVTLGVGVAPPTSEEHKEETKKEEEHKEEKGKEETKEEEEHKEEGKKEEHKEEKETTHVASPPEIGEVAPASGTVVTMPTPIKAHISAPSGESIASWSVAYQGTEPHATTFASGKGAPPETLATFDPTRLANGDYKITVTATTSSGGVQSESTSLTVSGNLKLGRYLETYKDLEIPVAGFNMDVERVYDSTDKSVGDFGVGWNLMLSNFKVQTNGPLGEGGWVQRESECLFGEPTEGEPGEESSGLCAYAYESRPQHTVTVTLPDGQTEVFVFEPRGEYFNNLEVLPRFTAKAGTDTTSTLEVDEPTEILNGFDGTLYEGDFENPWTAQTFLLTTRAGVKYVLNTERGVISEEDLNHNKLTFTHNGIESSTGSKLTLTRDPQGRITEITGPSEQHLHYGYDAAGDLTSYTDADGNTTTYTYDSDHDLLSTTGSGASKPLQTLRYNEEGRLDEAIDAEGQATKIATNVGQRTETVTDPNGKLTTINTYNELGSPVEEVKVAEGKTRTTKHTYDSEGHLLSSTDPEGHTATNKWEDGNLVAHTDADGNTSKYEYNALGELAGVIGPDGAKQLQLTRNAEGNPTKIERAGEGVYKYEYNSQGNPTKITTPAGVTDTIAYDTNGYPSAITDGESHATHLVYNFSGQLLEEEGPTGAKTSYTYDRDGNLASMTDGLGRTTTFTYNSFGQQITATDPLGRTETSTYDEAGRLVKKVDRDGETTTYAYDADGKLTEEAMGGEAVKTSYNAFEQPVSISNETQTLTFGYDEDGRTAEVAASAVGAAPASAAKYTYDPDGNRTQMTGPEGTTSYSYDPYSRLSSLTPAGEPEGKSFGFTYSPVGQLAEITRPDGVTDTLSYQGEDLVSRTSTLGSTTLASSTYAYNQAGLRSSLANAEGKSTGYAYDSLGELTYEASEGQTATRYEYDAAGNRDALSGPTGTAAYSYNEAEELTSNGAETLSYNPDGELTKRTVNSAGASTTYEWNSREELTTVHLPSGKIETFAYDPLGRLVSTSNGEKTTSYVYDGQNVHLEYEGSGTAPASSPSAVYVDGLKPNEVLEMSRGGKRYSYLVDGQGSTLALADEAGNVVQRDSYNAFGNPTISGSLANPFLYTGQMWEPEIGLYYDRARYYEPTSGRFISRDPVLHPNPYTYVGNDPTNATDPSGEFGLIEEEAEESIEATLDSEEASLISGASSKGVEQAAITLYRAVGDEELASIESTGTYTVLEGNVEGKYFFPSFEQAQAFVDTGWATTVTSAEFPLQILESVDLIEPSAEGFGFVIPSEVFPFGPVTILSG
jgi:RHS repeat-associated protein